MQEEISATEKDVPAPPPADWVPLLNATVRTAQAFLEGLPARRVGPDATPQELRAALGGPLPEEPAAAEAVIDALAEQVDHGLLATPSARFFGFVIGGSVPAALAADWLTATWDQNAGLYAAGPAAAVAEEVIRGWLVELLGLPSGTSAGFVTGGQMANFTGLAAARHHVLAAAGWDVERDGLVGAPPIRVLVGEERHTTIDRALRFLGLGSRPIAVAADDQGRMRPDALARELASGSGPAIVCTQAGNVNSGAFDPFEPVCDLAHDHGAWVHVDGAFGLWAAVSDDLRHLLAGAERADSWATDAHKWLNVPYDSGIAFCAHPDSHRRAMGTTASYLIQDGSTTRDEMDWNPEFSRRARAFPIYAAIRSLGRSGIVAMVERCCALAQRFARRLGETPTAEVLNDIVLNQVVVRFPAADGDDDAHTRAVIDAVQREGTCWMSGTNWRGQAAMRISVSNWSTTVDDVDRSVDAILRCVRQVG